MTSFSEKILGSSKYISIFKDILSNGTYYVEARKIIRMAKSFSRQDIEYYQYQRLKKVIHYAYEHIPYYQELFDKINFKPEDFKQTKDISAIPYLTKSLIRENYQKLISNEIPRNHLKLVKTGGSTGAPLEFYLDRRTSTPMEFAYLQYIWKRIGYQFRDKCVILRAESFGNDQNRTVYWRMNYPMNWLAMSPFHLAENTAHYLDKIRSFAPRFIIAYPSTLYILARYLKSNNLPPIKSLKGIICSSETLYAWQRKFIKEVFQVNVFTYYGHTEKCCIAPQCEHSDYYEFIPTYGFVEIVNRANQWCENDGESGEIVATSFNSLTTPFIRYKTQDICTLSASACNGHEGWLTVKEITGRSSEFLVNTNGDLIMFTGSDEPFWHIMHKLNAYQYVQDTPGKIEVKLDIKEPLTQNELAEMMSVFENFYQRFEIKIQEVENIPRTQSGKFRYLIQKIPIDYNPHA